MQLPKSAPRFRNTPIVLMFRFHMATAPERIGWEIVDDTHLRLIWKDFEPRTQKDRRGFRLSRPWHGFEDSPVKPSPAGSSAPQAN